VAPRSIDVYDIFSGDPFDFFYDSPVTLNQLRTFLAVAERESVRAAAEHLFVAQPSVSAAVSSLERELGVALVARHGRGLRLTPAGIAFAADVRESLGMLERGVRAARAVARPGGGEVRIAAVTTAAEQLLLPLIARFSQRYGNARVTVQVGNRTTVWEALRDHEADLVVAGRPPQDAPSLVLGTAANTLVLVGPASWRGATELTGTTWLLREEGSGTREATEELLASLGLRPATMILGSNGAIERAVGEGLGVALVPLAVAGPAIDVGSIAVLDCPGTPMERPWHLVCHRRDRLGPTPALLARSFTAGAGGFSLTADGGRVLAEALDRRAP
jgi:LysR family transcriptional regulator, low CO2-responsive transcriptional regulator